MIDGMMKRMTGEELLLMRILGGDGVAGTIDTELDRRAIMGESQRTQPQVSVAWRDIPTDVTMPRVAA